jgi:IclR family transcriptional regulator, pca regulon regulatory protein
MSVTIPDPAIAPRVDRRDEFVQSIARGFAIIKAFSSQPQALTIADVARRTGLSRAVSRRFLLTLTQLGYVASSDGVFRLTPRVLELGYTFLSTMKLPDVAEPVMEDVVSRLHESCSMSVLDGEDIVYVARVPSKRIMSIALAVGSRLPAFPTSMGRVLLADLSRTALDQYLATTKLRRLTERTVTNPVELRRILAQVRERGWASVDQEVEVGVRSVAAPIRDRNGRTVAALNVSSHASRVNLKELRTRHLPVVLDATKRISAMLGA